MGLLTYTCSLLSVDPKQHRADTDTHIITQIYIVLCQQGGAELS